ncbi:MAG: hypothetical protein AABN95_01010 [Acidobacteriota bacterium]
MAEEEGIHKHAFWLYGVLVGIAIKHALDATIPHIFDPANIASQLTANQLALPQASYGPAPDLGRLLVFLILIVRFYLGSAFFFSDIHDAGYGVSDPSEPFKKNYALDFICGFTHFVAFVILAMNIDVHTRQLFWFPVLVGFILFYDFIWWVFSQRYYSADYIFWWMVANSITLIVSGMVYLLAYYPLHRDPLVAEACAFLPVVAVSAYDIGAMMMDKPYFESVQNRLSRKPKKPRRGQRNNPQPSPRGGILSPPR